MRRLSVRRVLSVVIPYIVTAFAATPLPIGLSQTSPNLSVERSLIRLPNRSSKSVDGAGRVRTEPGISTKYGHRERHETEHAKTAANCAGTTQTNAPDHLPLTCDVTIQ